MKFLSQQASHDLLKNVEAWVHLVSQTHVRQGQVHAWVHLVSQTQGRECQVHAWVGTSCLSKPQGKDHVHAWVQLDSWTQHRKRPTPARPSESCQFEGFVKQWWFPAQKWRNPFILYWELPITSNFKSTSIEITANPQNKGIEISDPTQQNIGDGHGNKKKQRPAKRSNIQKELNKKPGSNEQPSTDIFFSPESVW